MNSHLVLQQEMKTEGESQYEEKEDKKEGSKGPEDISEHEDENAEGRKVLYEKQQSHPRKEDCCGSALPLPDLINDKTLTV